MSHRHISQLSLHTAQISLMFHSPLTSTLDLPSQCYLIQSHCAASAYSSATLSSASMTSQYHCSNTSQPRKSNLASNVNTRHVRQITQTLQVTVSSYKSGKWHEPQTYTWMLKQADRDTAPNQQGPWVSEETQQQVDTRMGSSFHTPRPAFPGSSHLPHYPPNHNSNYLLSIKNIIEYLRNKWP